MLLKDKYWESLKLEDGSDQIKRSYEMVEGTLDVKYRAVAKLSIDNNLHLLRERLKRTVKTIVRYTLSRDDGNDRFCFVQCQFSVVSKRHYTLRLVERTCGKLRTRFMKSNPTHLGNPPRYSSPDTRGFCSKREFHESDVNACMASLCLGLRRVAI